MSNKIAVKISGSIVSSLVFEHVNSAGDQEGFLLGELVTRITRTISDSHMSAEKEETSLHIYTIVPCDEQSFSFYDCAGAIQEEKLNYYVKDRRKDVIGWYKFRRNTPLEISLREQVVHENLCRAISPGLQQFFLFGIFTSCNTHDMSTYTFDHIILRSTRLGFERSSLNIINLGTTSHAEYLLHPHDATNILAGCFNEAVNSIDVESVESVNHVLDMHRELRVRLEAVKEDVAAAEAIVGSMCLDIAELQYKIQTLQARKDARKQKKERKEQDKESAQKAVQSEEVEQLAADFQECIEQDHSDIQKMEENVPIEEKENTSISRSVSLNAEKQSVYLCTGGASSSEKNAT